MSMTYYAVTDDPNELAHWGVKGMKWGVRHDKPRHTGSRRPRSAAYKKAQSKLGKMMKSGIKKAEAHWKAYNSPKVKEQRFMNRAIQKARNGTLRYGKLSDDQVRRVIERLALERNARQLGNTENPSYLKRIRTAVGEGVVRGLGQGTGAYIEERLRGRGRSTADIKATKRKTRYEQSGRVLRKKAKTEAKKEFYEDQAKEGNLHSEAWVASKNLAKLGVLAIKDPKNLAYQNERKAIKNSMRTSLTQSGRARLIAEKREADRESERTRRQQEARDKAYYQAYGKKEAEEELKRKYNLPSTVNSSNVSSNASTTNSSTPIVRVHRTNRDRQRQRAGRKKTRVDYN